MFVSRDLNDLFSLSLSPEEKSGTFVTFVSLDDSYA